MGAIQSSINRLFLASVGTMAGFQKLFPEKGEEAPKQEEPKEPVEDQSGASEGDIEKLLKEKGFNTNNPFIKDQLSRITKEYNEGGSGSYNPVESLSRSYENTRSVQQSVEERMRAVEEARRMQSLEGHRKELREALNAARGKMTVAKKEKAKEMEKDGQE
mgnify:CR=1 FL=1